MTERATEDEDTVNHISAPNAAGPEVDIVTPGPSVGSGLGRYRGTDYFSMSDMLTAEERDVRTRVSRFVDDEVLPVANGYWERAEFPHDLVSRLPELGIVGGTIQGHG